jgi:hypothetical protein
MTYSQNALIKYLIIKTSIYISHKLVNLINENEEEFRTVHFMLNDAEALNQIPSFISDQAAEIYTGFIASITEDSSEMTNSINRTAKIFDLKYNDFVLKTEKKMKLQKYLNKLEQILDNKIATNLKKVN